MDGKRKFVNAHGPYQIIKVIPKMCSICALCDGLELNNNLLSYGSSIGGCD